MGIGGKPNMRNWDRAKWLWARLGDIALAKEIIVVGITVVATLGAPLLAWAVSPMSAIDFLIIAFIAGTLSFFLARHFAPRIVERHTHHKELTATVGYTAKLGIAVQRANDTPMWEAIEYVAKSIGDAAQFAPAARQAIRQLALDGALKIRGRKELVGGPPNQTTFSAVYSEIPPEYWRNSVLSVLATDRGAWSLGGVHTDPETAASWHPTNYLFALTLPRTFIQ